MLSTHGLRVAGHHVTVNSLAKDTHRTNQTALVGQPWEVPPVFLALIVCTFISSHQLKMTMSVCLLRCVTIVNVIMTGAGRGQAPDGQGLRAQVDACMRLHVSTPLYYCA